MLKLHSSGLAVKINALVTGRDAALPNRFTIWCALVSIELDVAVNKA